MYKISIITVNFNNLKGIRRTIHSVLHQQYKSIEHIVIDGGSTDGSREYIESMNDFFSYWVSEKDRGIYDGMNKGISKATGDYVLFLNSGDYFDDNNALNKVMNKIEGKPDLIICRQKFIDNKGKKSISPILRRYQICMGFFLSSTFPHQATLISRSLFTISGLYDEQYKVSADWVFWVRSVMEYKCSYALSRIALSVMETGGVSNDMDKCHTDMRNFLMLYLEKGILKWEDIFEQSMRSRAFDFCEVHHFSKLISKVLIWLGKYC